MNDEHTMLRDSLVGRLATHDGKTAWNALGDGGVIGLCVPEDLGGLGLLPTDGSIGRTLLADIFS